VKLIKLHLFNSHDELYISAEAIVSIRRVHYAHDDATEVSLRDTVPDVLTVTEQPAEVAQLLVQEGAILLLSDDELREPSLPFEGL